MITSEEFREASSLGKEMIDGERALQDVAVVVSRASGVKSVAATTHIRNTSRVVQRKRPFPSRSTYTAWSTFRATVPSSRASFSHVSTLPRGTTGCG